jgi:LPS-assembly lipoprotein
MSWSKLAVAAVLLLGAACGFQPLYGSRTPGAAPVQAELEDILIEPIAERTGQKLYNFLRDRLNPRGRPDQPRYVLSVKLTERQENLALATDKTPTRANLTLIANYTLRSRDREELLYEGRSRTTTSFDIVQSLFSSYTATEDARARGALTLSDDIRVRLALFLARQRQQGS